MPSWLRDPDIAPEGLRAFLGGLVPEAQLTNGPIDGTYDPLLLMQTRHLVAAFAFANGDMRESYDALYASFKRYYADRQGDWDALDVAFVFCVRPDAPQLEEFCSSVETDVYFCRKFVVPLTPPLGQSLARLPFLPLTPLRGHSSRPASAQTFLQQCSVPAVLAKFLVVQHERSPEGIVEDCANGEFGTPRSLVASAGSGFVQADRSRDLVRLESVEIKNFRAYRGAQPFDIGADVTVLYGPNGFGKTSFFDAVDFAVTGGVGRLESRRKRDFAKTARHLDSSSEESLVSLSFRVNGAVRKVTRSVSERNQGVLDGRPSDRKAILMALTRGSIPATDRVENFVSLFRASHLFSQEQQELTRDFQEDCEISAQIVSRMLAFEDYANAVNKARKVREVLYAVVASANQEIGELVEEMASGRKELERIGKVAESRASVGVLEEEIEALRSKVKAAGVAVAPGKPDASVVRAWRASVEARYSESQRAGGRLGVLAGEVASLPRLRGELAASQEQMLKKDQVLKLVEDRRMSLEALLRQLEQGLAQASARVVESQTEVDALEWIRNTRPEYAELIEEEGVRTVELQRASEALTQARAAEDRAAGEVRALEVAAARVAEGLEALRKELAAVEGVREAIAAWRANRSRLREVLQSEEAERKTLESLRVEERELSPQAAAVSAEEGRLSRQIADVDKGQSELRTLVSQLHRHIRGGTCPLCGENHGSREGLLQRIQEHVEADAASVARVELSAIRERSRELSERIAANRSKQQDASARIAVFAEERTRLETEGGQFAVAAGGLGIGIDTEAEGSERELHTRADGLGQAIADVDQESRDADAALEGARAALANAKRRVSEANAEVVGQRQILSRVQEGKRFLREDPRATRVSLEMNVEELGERERANRERLETWRSAVAGAEADVAGKRPELSGLRQEAAQLKSEIAVLQGQVASLQRAVAQIGVRVAEANVPVDTGEELLQAMIAEECRVQSHLTVLRDSLTSVEVAIDSATTAAALASLLQGVRQKEDALAQATERRDRHQPWLKYFDDVSRLVSSEQNEAIASFVQEYGPRTSIIQRRLRSVYGFDDIEIRSRESAISVWVRRRGEVLRPTDYFSQSQQQALLLGLFLTACTSQTWSAFSPVFLDDPVTHFDDLNTYAFLDLIVGLLESDGGHRQFIMSTCDEKLLQLARQKFRHLGTRAKFYQFTALGVEGPVVRSL